jgi:hypothetical protein
MTPHEKFLGSAMLRRAFELWRITLWAWIEHDLVIQVSSETLVHLQVWQNKRA